ncbi:phage tail tape measure protein [Larkinella bovis]|uniref:Phage tail tape measure protein n=1 Tax=Larkinella bovis TaxID=683041 RepID=A0ABW0IBP7_9BACT
MAEPVESIWDLDLRILEKLEKVGFAFDKVADKEDRAKKSDPFKEAARSATNYNSKLLQNTRIYAQITNSAKSYEAEIKRLQAVQAELNRRQAEFTAVGKYARLQKEILTVTNQLKKLNDEQQKFNRGREGQNRDGGQGRDSRGRFTPGSGRGGGSGSGSGSGGLGGQLGNLSQNLSSKLTGIVGGLFALDKAFDLVVRGPAEFGRALSQLSAITGATGDDLKFLRDQAIEFEKETGKSALAMVQAFQTVGSIKPELLENKELLVQTTKEVIALQDAAGNISLEEAAESLLGSLNQFNAGAEEASRFVNVLAAGAKEGSSEIKDTAAAFKASGSALASAGISFEQSNALVQILAKNMVLGAEAGTQMRNIFLKLESSTDKDLRPSVVGLSTALENASKKFNTTTKITKEFGVENVLAAKQILDNRKEIDGLTASLTGTNTAYAQQKTNINNLATDLDKLGTAFVGLFRDMGESQDGFFRKITQGITRMINGFRSGKSELIAFARAYMLTGKIDAGIDAFLEQRRSNIEDQEKAAAKEARVKSIISQARQQVATSLNERLEVERKESGKEYDETLAKIKAAEKELEFRKQQVVQARAQYKDVADRGLLKGKTFTAEGAELTAAKQAVKVAEEQLKSAQKQKQMRDEATAKAALDDEAKEKKAGEKQAKILSAQQKKALDLKEKYESELQDLENEYGKERLESLKKDSSAYLQEKARLDTLMINQEEQAFLKLKQLAAGAKAGKFDKNGDPIADTSTELSTGEVELFERRRQAVNDRLQREQQEFYKKEIDEVQEHQDKVDELIGSEYDQQVTKVRQKYSEILKLVRQGSNDEVRLIKARDQELAQLDLERKLKLNEQQNAGKLADAEKAVTEAQISGRYDLERKAQMRLLEVEAQGLLERLKLIEQFGDSSTEEERQAIQKRITTVQGQLKQLQRQPAFGSIYELLAGDPSKNEKDPEKKDKLAKDFAAQVQAVQSMEKAMTDTITIMTQASIDASNERIRKIDEEIQKKQEQISEEKRLQESGTASNLSLRQMELDALKTQKAQEEQVRRRAIKTQMLLESGALISTNALTVANLIAAISEQYRVNSKFGLVGLASAIAAGFTILGTFASLKAKVKAANASSASQTFREGGWLEGPSHEQGGIRGTGAFNDVEVEGGEHITRKSRAGRYASLLDAINDGGHTPFPWADVKRLASEKGVLLHETTGIASQKALGAMASAQRNRASIQPITQGSINRLADELAAFRAENNSNWDRSHNTSEYVAGNKRVRKEGRRTTITTIDNDSAQLKELIDQSKQIVRELSCLSPINSWRQNLKRICH